MAAGKRAEARTRYYTRAEADRIGWDVRHPNQGGSFLEEQEIVDYFPDLKPALGDERPDFAAIFGNKPRVIIECKSDWRDLDKAVNEAQGYADTINRVRDHDARIAIGVAGTPDMRIQIRAAFKTHNRRWVDLQSHDYPLTQIPMPVEVETALVNDNGTTDVQLPNEREFFVAAINISRLLRLAKIEEAVRPKVIGSIILALYHGNFNLDPDVVIENINTNVRAAIKVFSDIPKERRDFLAETLLLSTESDRLRPKIGDVVNQLERLNVRSIMRSGVDFLGQFYETFLRYGQDTKKLGIVFTPRHITRFSADIADVKLGRTVYDPACGTGGFLVASFDRMMKQATTNAARRTIKESLYGFDTNATVWSLAVLNMFFRGDGKSYISYGDCFERGPKNHQHDYALLNPPFSQEGEPETDFIDHALAATKPGGTVVAVVKTSVLVDSDLTKWRKALVEEHHVEGVISLPTELFYPTSIPTSLLIAKAHVPDRKLGTFLARVNNDGFEISKKRRVPIEGSQLPQILDLFRKYRRNRSFETLPGLAMTVDRDVLVDGEEICAERWLPTASFSIREYEELRRDTLKQLTLSVANYPEVTEGLINDYEGALAAGHAKGRPTNKAPLSAWFDIRNGRSSGSKNYAPGPIPYVSSGESYNGIVGFFEPPEDEIYSDPRISVSCFGPAFIQPWRFAARGNGGSAVRVLQPRFAMTVPELLWFVAQINYQRWRFHFGRMALPERLNKLMVDPPIMELPRIAPLRRLILSMHHSLSEIMESDSPSNEEEEDRLDSDAARQSLEEIERDPNTLITGEKLKARFNELLS